MTIRRLSHVAVALLTLIAPLAALAQVEDGSVTTAPLATAPVMGLPVLALLAVVLTGAAAYFLRRAPGRTIAAVSFVAALSALAGLGYATPTVMIMVQGSQCGMPTTQMFDPNQLNTLVSHCQNSIQIISIELGMSCAFDQVGSLADGVGLCRVGQVLTNGEDCTLPGCPT